MVAVHRPTTSGRVSPEPQSSSKNRQPTATSSFPSPSCQSSTMAMGTPSPRPGLATSTTAKTLMLPSYRPDCLATLSPPEPPSKPAGDGVTSRI
jgi:hypothetical protein